MSRVSVVLAIWGLSLSVAAVVLFVQNGRLRAELESARTAGEKAAPANAPAADEEAAKAKKFADGLVRKIDDLEAELGAARKDLAAKKDPKVPVKEPGKDGEKDDPATARMREIMRKLGKVLPLGEDMSEAAIKELGLEPGQVAAVNIATKDENKRMTEALQRFYAENFSADEAGLYEKPGNELMRLMLGKVMGEVMELSKIPPEKSMGIHTGETSLEELLGPDKVASKLAREIHAQRLKTYEALASSLTPDQLAKFRDEYWREGSLYYPGNEHYEFGMAPKDMKK